MKFLLIIILVAGCQISFGQDRVARAFAGCYELQGLNIHTSNYSVVPSRLQLTLERDSTSGMFVAKKLDSRSMREASWRWHIQRDGSVELIPSGGWITDGWFIQLNISGPGFRGTARYWTDTGDTGRTFGVVGHKVTCNKQGNNDFAPFIPPASNE